MNVRIDGLAVLLVSADQVVTATFRARLEFDDYEVCVVTNLPDALSAVHLRTPDLVFVDRTTDRAAASDVIEALTSDEACRSVPIVCVDLQTELGEDPGRLAYTLATSGLPGGGDARRGAGVPVASRQL